MRRLPDRDPEPPRARTWSFSFSVTRQDPEEGARTALAWVKRLTALDLLAAAALLTLAAVEPFGVYLYLTRHGALVPAEACKSAGSGVVVVSARAAAEAAETGHGDSPGSEVGGTSDVITPLNARNPADLIMGPAVYEPPPAAAEAPSAQDSVWDRVVESAEPAKTPAKRGTK